MSKTHPLFDEIARLSTVEQAIIDRFIHRQRVARDLTQGTASFGERVADRVASFGGSWTFILLAVATISSWVLLNLRMVKAFDPYPFILLNLVLSCTAALQAPVIMMSQNRQAARDRADAQHDYEVNVKPSWRSSRFTRSWTRFGSRSGWSC
jgi:uncharacterized membrane protein